MRLKIDRRVRADVAVWFNNCFKVAVARLGIADYDRTVLLKFDRSPVGAADEGGAFFPAFDQIGRMKLGKAPKRFMITVVPKGSVERMLATFCHELIHLKQYVTGEIGAKAGAGRAIPTYFNHEAAGLEYRERPWEQEAHGKMYELAEYVLSKVGPPPA